MLMDVELAVLQTLSLEPLFCTEIFRFDQFSAIKSPNSRIADSIKVVACNAVISIALDVLFLYVKYILP
jgi:hypothetical protein